jgi:restriction system protein
MARTYYAEGRQIAYILRGLFIIIGLTLYFKVLPGLHWGFFFGILFGSVIIADIIGAIWTRKRRLEKKLIKAQIPSKAVVIKGGLTSKDAPVSTKLTNEQVIKADVNSLSGTDFERLMEMYYKDQGYNVQRVGGSGDHEVDLIIKGKEGYKIAVQCKRWKQDVGNDIVLRLKAGKQVHECYDAWIVTTSNFTKSAREAAERLNIKLINGIALQDKLNSWKKRKQTI